jgi:predicted RNase H-like nuclease (RuvC/YqgF family)
VAIGLKSDVNRGITTELLEELRRTIERLERDKEFLQARLEAKEREIERLHDIITNRLPGKVDPQWTEGGAQARSVEYMQQTINAQREEIERLRRELEERRPWWQRLFRRS